MAGNLALEAPKGAITIEDAIAKEVGEEGVEAGAFRVAGEVSFENMVDDTGICGREEDGATEEDAAGECGRAVKEFAGPFIEAMLVDDDEGEAANQGKSRGARVGTIAGMMLP